MRLLSVAVVPAIVGVLLVCSGADVVRTIGPANVDPAPAGDAKPVLAGSRPEVQQRVLDKGSDRDAVVSLLLLLGMYQGRRPVGSP
jgi:hypothetical protein